MRIGTGRTGAQSGKMLIPLLGAVAVLAMAVAGYSIFVLTEERATRLRKERDLKMALAENSGLKAQVDELQQAKAGIEDELSRARRELTQSQQDLAKAVETQETLTRSVEDREREIGRLTKDLDQTRAEQKEAAARLTELQSEHGTIKQQMADLERAKSELETKVMELSQQPTVELDKVVVSGGGPGSSASMAPAPTSAAMMTSAGTSAGGQIVVVNREYDFIVMNMGKNQGLTIGQEFKIVRGNETLGRVKVEKVYDELSAAAILPESKKESIREGDAVVAL